MRGTDLICLIALTMTAASPASAQPDVLWRETCGGSGADAARSMIQAGDGGLVMAGYTYSSGAGDLDAYLVRTDAAGHLEWARTYGGPRRDCAEDVCQTPDGGFLIVGWTTSYGAGDADFYLVKTDAGGQPSWSRTFGGEQRDFGYSVCPAPGGGFVVCGSSASFGAGASDIYLLKTDDVGEPQWSRTFGSPLTDRGAHVSAVSAGGYLVVGSAGPPDPGNRDVLVIRTDAEGNEVWTTPIGTPDDCDFGIMACEAADGSFMILGESDILFYELQDITLHKVDALGHHQWTRRFTESACYDYGHDICRTPDDGFCIAGATKVMQSSQTDLYVIKTNSQGVLQWRATFGGPAADWGSAVVATGPGTYAVAGFTASSGAGRNDIWVLSLYEPLPQGVELPRGPAGLRIDPPSPNPLDAAASIRFHLPQHGRAELYIVDVQGHRLETLVDAQLREGEHAAVWRTGTHAAGIYYSVLRAGGATASRPLTVIR